MRTASIAGLTSLVLLTGLVPSGVAAQASAPGRSGLAPGAAPPGAAPPGAAPPGAAPPGAPAAAAREQTVDQQTHHVLNRLAFGPRPGDGAAVRAMGVDRWIEQQLHPERINDSAATAFLGRFTTLSMTGEELLAAYPPPGAALARLARARRMQPGMDDSPGSAGSPPQGRAIEIRAADSAKLRAQGRQSYAFLGEIATSRIARAVTSNRQLEEVMVDFWENHFNVFAGKDRTRYFLAEYDARAIRPHAMGNFRDLLGAVAKSPAMLYYLDNWQSVADSGRPTLAQAPNGPPARRARQRLRQQNPGLQPLAARRRGLNENYARELMELHTLGVDGGYTQNDVIEVARTLTGWTLEKGAQGGSFLFRPVAHDAGAKTILGRSFPAGRGIEEGEAVLDLLASHPATAKFIATKLARRFVSDTPPAALVQRAADRFTRTGGDIRETLRVIVTSPEFFAASAYRAKVKSPFELVSSTLRAMNASPDATPRVVQLVTRLGQPIFGHQAPNGYPETGEAWMNTGSILNRINFGLAVAADRVPGVRLADWPATKTLASQSRAAQVDGVIRELLGGAVSADTRQVLIRGTNPFLEARGGATDSLLAGSDDDPMMGTVAAGASTTGPATNANRQARRGARAADQAGPRQQMQAGREAVKPSAGASLTQAIGPLPNLTGFAQIVGLAIGAPEFQRR
jgi:uncharacterized protein (DUF1800 family)